MATTGLANAYSKLNRHAGAHRFKCPRSGSDCAEQAWLSSWRGVTEAIEAYDVVLSKDPTDSRAKLLRGVPHHHLRHQMADALIALLRFIVVGLGTC